MAYRKLNHGTTKTALPSIRLKLALLVLACIVPASAAAAILLHYSYLSERQNLERQELQAARALSQAVDHDLGSVLAAAQVLATSPHLLSDQLDQFHARALAVLRDGIGSTVVVSDAQGMQVVNTLRPFGDPLPAHGNPDLARRVFETGKPVFSDLFIGGLLHRPVVTVEVPVFRDGKVLYCLSMGIFPERLATILQEQNLPPNWIAAVFDTQGTIISRTHEPDKFVGKKGTPILVERMRQVEDGLSENNTLEGIAVLGAFSRSHVSQWSVAIGVPKHILYAPLQRTMLLFGSVVGTLLIASLGLAWFTGGQIARSVRALTGPALALGSGETAAVPRLHIREAAEVVQALETAGELLRQRTAERDNANEGKRLLQARLRLAELSASHSLYDLLVATLDEACALTGARQGFFHFVMPDQASLSLQAWSTATTRDFCHAAESVQHGDLGAAGIWADAIRQRRPVVYNDYLAAPGRRGLPPGHGEVRRLVSIPILRDQRIVAVIGLSNKSSDFHDGDVEVVEALAQMAWDLAERKQAEDALVERTALVRRRYESLRALNEVAALPPSRICQQLVQALTLGARHLELPLGIISRVDCEDYRILHHCAPPDAGLSDGQVLALRDTYCALTLEAEDVVAVQHMALSEHASHPCYRQTHLEAYIGAPVMVADRPYGTVSFSSPTPYARAFDDGDREFMRLLARWIGSVIERDRAQAEILSARDAAKEQARELAISNNDLEQFAYVASHDLREPLRMVNSYLALIERRYMDKLDDDGRVFIGYARDGAVRMNNLILDLLEYSRVGRHGEPPAPVDLADAANEACAHLQALADEAGATITIDGVPATVTGNRTEFVRLFQNLIGNAIKYRAPDRPPQVTVAWRRRDGDWLVSVTDNGTGIPPEYHADAFKIFRRLHSDERHQGTGIGLAICDKIVKNLGGRIWIEANPGGGSVFVFTVQAR